MVTAIPETTQLTYCLNQCLCNFGICYFMKNNWSDAGNYLFFFGTDKNKVFSCFCSLCKRKPFQRLLLQIKHDTLTPLLHDVLMDFWVTQGWQFSSRSHYQSNNYFVSALWLGAFINIFDFNLNCGNEAIFSPMLSMFIQPASNIKGRTHRTKYLRCTSGSPSSGHWSLNPTDPVHNILRCITKSFLLC